MVAAVKTAIDEKIWEQGHMTADKFTELLGDFKTDMLEAHRKEIAESREEVRHLGVNHEATFPSLMGTTSHAGGGCTFSHSGGFFMSHKISSFHQTLTFALP